MVMLYDDDLHQVGIEDSVVNAVRKPVEHATANVWTNLLELARASNNRFDSGLYFSQKFVVKSGSLLEIVVGRFVNVA